MRLATLKTSDGDRVVSVIFNNGESQFVDLTSIDNEIPRSLKALLSQTDGLLRAAAASEKGAEAGQFITGRLRAPIVSPGKVICIGLNYRDHAIESGAEIPTEPVCFGKFSQTIVGPDDPIKLPRVSSEVDYEAELVVVIGREGKHISEDDAMSYVAGYMNGHDVSARDWQAGRPGGQWLLGKTPDTFAPTGPWLVTADEVPDPHKLSIALRLNGETMQDSSTAQLIFNINQLIAHLSQLITLQPGDVIFTGTPPGVGAARKPPVFLKPGDVAEVEIEGLGTLSNPVEAE